VDIPSQHIIMNNSAQSTAHDTFLTSYLRSRPRWLRALGVPDPAVSAIDLASPPRHLRRTLHGNSRARFLLTADRDAALARLSSTPPPPPRATDPVDEPLPSIDGDAEGERRMFTRYQGLKDRLSRLRNKIPVSWEKFQELDVTQRATRRQVERMEVAYPKYIAHWDAEVRRPC
jgi:hypothetical protein